jgi:enterochelin esterase-like enzyme
MIARLDVDAIRQGDKINRVLALALLSATILVACTEATPAPTTVSTTTIPTVFTPPATPTPTAIPATLTPTPTPMPTFTPTPTPPPPTPTSPTPTPTCTETQGRIEVGTFFSTVIGQEQPYRVYLPPCYDSLADSGHRFDDGRYPVLYMLHGYPFDDSHWDEIGIDEAADAGIVSGALPSFVIAMPGADNEGTYTNTSGGPGSFEAVLMDEFIPFIEATYRVADRAGGRAIGGMSRGGVWSLEIAFRNPDRFAVVGGHSVALNMNRAPPVYDPLYLAADPAIRSLRIYLDVGEDDWTLPAMEELHAALTAAGVTHDYYVYPGRHDDSYWSAHVGEYLVFYTADW